MDIHRKSLAALAVLSCLALSSATWAQTTAAPSHPAGTSATGAKGYASEESREEARAAARDVDKAARLIERMRADPKGAQLLAEARGVFVVPKFGRGALGVGGQGGVGLLLVKHGSAWSDPAFYNFGGVSVGAQIGGEGGSFVLVLNNDRAVNSFTQRNNWSLDANAGLTIVNWSKEGQGNAGKGDISLWSDAKGLFAGASVSVNDIKFDQDQTSGYYGRQVSVNDVVNGSVNKAQADQLKSALAKAAGKGPSASNAPTSSLASGSTPSMPNSANRPARGR